MKSIIKVITEEFSTLDRSSNRLRQFGFLIGGAMILVAVFVLYRNGVTQTRFIFLSTGAVIVLIGVLYPRVLDMPYRVWMVIALVLGFIMGNVLLAVLYLFVLIPVGVFMRICRHDPLERRFDAFATTYWRKRDGEYSDMRRPF